MSEEKKSKLKTFWSKFSGAAKRPQPSGTFMVAPEPVANETVSAQEPVVAVEKTPSIAPSSPFAANAKIKPIGTDRAQDSPMVQAGNNPPSATDEIMGMLSKVSQAPAGPKPLEAHEVVLDMKTDIGWEAQLEEAKERIVVMSPADFKKTYGIDIKKATIAARYNLIEIIDDVLKNGNRAHAFDQIIETGRAIIQKGNRQQLVVVGEFTYQVDKPAPAAPAQQSQQ